MTISEEEEKETSFRRTVLQTIEAVIDINHISDLSRYLPHLHALGWDEVVEERFLNKQCGFPACPKAPSNQKMTQMYQIDRKEGKIYEFCKQRNKFCSERCYQMSIFVRNQLEEHPLWITGLSESRMSKVYEVPDESFVSPVPEKTKSSDIEFKEENTIEYVTDSIIANVQNMKLQEESSENIDSEEPEKEPYTLTSDDKDFIKSIRQFRAANFSQKSSSNTLKTPIKEKPKLSEKNQKKEEEILSKLREKYGNKNAKQKKPPILIDAPKFHPKFRENHSMENTIDENDMWLVDLIKSWFTAETRKLIREGARPTGGATEQILMDFLSGKKVDAQKMVDLPNLDKYNVKEKRLNIFLHSIKHHWLELEAKMNVTPTRRDLLSRVATTFCLDSENITGWNKQELKTIVIALFILICHVDVELGDDYFKNDNPSPELSAVSNDLCGMDSSKLASLRRIIRNL